MFSREAYAYQHLKTGELKAEFSYHVATKKNPACQVNDLAKEESGSQVISIRESDLLTATNKNVWCTTMARAKARKEVVADARGSMPLPVYEHCESS